MQMNDLVARLKLHAEGPPECECGQLRDGPWLNTCTEEGQCDWNRDYGLHTTGGFDAFQAKIDMLEAAEVIRAYTTALTGDAAGVVERFKSLLNPLAEQMPDDLRLARITSAGLDLVPVIAAYAAEIDRCHARLEIDHHFVMSPNKPTDTVDDLVRVEIPMAERGNEPDGIECRDATITEQDRVITAQAERIAELERGILNIAAYPMGSGRCTDDGYPSEISYDEFAYRRLVDSYRAAARALLNKEGRG